MTEKEMLQYAARAMGYELSWWSHLRCSVRGDLEPQKAHIGNVVWNPRHDSAQAFEMAAQLNFDLYFSGEVVAQAFARQHRVYADAGIGDDKLSAARLAILRAAAEIGKQMGEAL